MNKEYEFEKNRESIENDTQKDITSRRANGFVRRDVL